MIRRVLTESQEIRSAVAAQQRTTGTIITAERSGPAFTIKIQTDDKESYQTCGCTCSNNRKDNLLFHADFTLALHCVFWPNQATGSYIFLIFSSIYWI